MAIDESLRAQLLTTLDLQNATIDRQDEILNKVEYLARKRLADLIPDMLSNDDLKVVEEMRARGDADDVIVDWVSNKLPDTYSRLLGTVLQAVADELGHTFRRIR